MVLKDFSSLRPGTVFCMVSFMGGKCVLARSKNRERLSYGRKTEISNYKKGDNDVIIP